ncbi:MAG TPA: RNA polymerase sigma-70 factor [Sphingobacteriaceae bacterium]
METGKGIYTNSAEFRKLFENCFHEYYEGLHRYAFTIVKENEQAKDIVQAVFCKWWEKRDDINIETSVKSYLYTAVYNQSLNHVRNIKNRKTFAVDFGDYKFDTPENKVDLEHSTELECKLMNAIDDLPTQCRIIFLKCKFEKRKYSEIATELNISVKTVEVQIGKAYKILRGRLINITSSSFLFLLLF